MPANALPYDLASLPTAATARALYASGGGHDFDHVLRVTALAERIAQAEGADLVIVRTAALLHDVAESEGRAEHHLRGAERARVLLQDQPPAFIEAVAHAIAAHRYRMPPEPQTLEARVLSDADKLDAIGAVGIARVFAYAGQRGTPLWRVPWRTIAAAGHAGDPAAGLRDPAGGAYTPVHEFVYKLNLIPARLYTATAARLAGERQAFMQAFFERLDAEAQGEA